MKPGDLLLDVKDFIGQLTPGFALLFVFALFRFVDVSGDVITIKDDALAELIKRVYRESWPLFWGLVLIGSYAMGAINAFVVFRARAVFIKRLHCRCWKCSANVGWIPSIREFLKSRDRQGDLLAFYEKEFEDGGILDDPYDSMHAFCKHSLAEDAPNTYKKLMKAEADMGFLMGMITPTLCASTWCFQNGLPFLSLTCAGVACALVIVARTTFRDEMFFIYRAYYIHRHAWK